MADAEVILTITGEHVDSGKLRLTNQLIIGVTPWVFGRWPEVKPDVEDQLKPQVWYFSIRSEHTQSVHEELRKIWQGDPVTVQWLTVRDSHYIVHS
jgi:hypothetical protein